MINYFQRREKEPEVKPVKEDVQGNVQGKSAKIDLSESGEKKRKSSITLYQSVDDDHPDLQSIQNIVANMTFSAD